MKRAAIKYSFYDKLRLVPLFRVAVALVVGILAGWWSLMLLPLLFVEILRGYLPIVFAGAALIILSSEKKELPADKNIDIIAVQGARIGQQHLYTSRVVAYKPAKSSVSEFKTVDERIILDVDPRIAAAANENDTVIYRNCRAENLDKSKLQRRSVTASNYRNGIRQSVTVLDLEPVSVIKGEPKGIMILSKQLQSRLSSRLDSLRLLDQDKATIKAMLLGDKNTIEKTTLRDYAHGGVSHVLAISGTHIGIIFLFLNLMFWWCEKRYRWRIIRSIAIVIILWVYAFVTGFSPSVCRSVVMFSLLQMSVGRITTHYNAYNILGASAIILLLIDPTLVYNISFQLSYLAVFAIIMFGSKINAIFENKPKLWRYLTVGIGVSLAVEIITLPVTLYYFGGFSTVGLINNLVISLTLPVILIGGIMYMIFPLMLFDYIIKIAFAVTNTVLSFSLKFPLAWIDRIELRLVDLLMLFAALVLMVLYAKKLNKYRNRFK